MGAHARQKRAAWDLPPAQRICIWCDQSAANAKTREHVVAESLGGEGDYRLKGGLVCDPCNRTVLKSIDDQMVLFGPLLSLRAHFGLAQDSKHVAQGIEFDLEQNEYTVDTTKLKHGNEVSFDPLRGEITSRISGPSPSARSEHMTRGLHRIAYNVLAHHHGGPYVRGCFRFLRDLVLNLDAIMNRAFVLDQNPILPTLQAQVMSPTPTRWKSTAEIRNGSDGEPETVRIAIGPAIFHVSVRHSTTPLHAVVAATPNAIVYGVLDGDYVT